MNFLFYFSHLFVLQLHLVHYNSDKYPDFGTAAASEEGLCVLGIFLKVNTNITRTCLLVITGPITEILLMTHNSDIIFRSTLSFRNKETITVRTTCITRAHGYLPQQTIFKFDNLKYLKDFTERMKDTSARQELMPGIDVRPHFEASFNLANMTVALFISS